MTNDQLDSMTEWALERAAILEYEAGMLREEAERMAWEMAEERFNERTGV